MDLMNGFLVGLSCGSMVACFGTGVNLDIVLYAVNCGAVIHRTFICIVENSGVSFSVLVRHFFPLRPRRVRFQIFDIATPLSPE